MPWHGTSIWELDAQNRKMVYGFQNCKPFFENKRRIFSQIKNIFLWPLFYVEVNGALVCVGVCCDSSIVLRGLDIKGMWHLRSTFVLSAILAFITIVTILLVWVEIFTRQGPSQRLPKIWCVLLLKKKKKLQNSLCNRSHLDLFPSLPFLFLPFYN